MKGNLELRNGKIVKEMHERHTGINEKKEKFEGMWFIKKHTVRSLKSARTWQKRYMADGYLVRTEKEMPGFYNVYVRRK